MNGWWCTATTQIIKFGRMIIGYNSLLVALIRYIYIVHHKKSNQWNFQKVGRLFKAASVVVPIMMESVGVFTNSYPEYTTQPTFNECIAFHQGLNNSDVIDIPRPAPVKWTMNYIPESVVLGIYYVYAAISVVVLLNVTEGFFYVRIHQSISR